MGRVAAPVVVAHRSGEGRANRAAAPVVAYRRARVELDVQKEGRGDGVRRRRRWWRGAFEVGVLESTVAVTPHGEHCVAPWRMLAADQQDVLGERDTPSGWLEHGHESATEHSVEDCVI